MEILAFKKLCMESEGRGAEVEKYLEPADKKIPKILKPESLQANQEFYENLRTGLRQLAQDKPSQDAQYSKNLGRVEFGSLKKKTNQMWSDSNTVVVPREDSGDRGRSISMLSDHSTAMPDLEVSQEVRREARMEVRMVEEEVLSKTEAEHPVESRQTGSDWADRGSAWTDRVFPPISSRLGNSSPPSRVQ